MNKNFISVVACVMSAMACLVSAVAIGVSFKKDPIPDVVEQVEFDTQIKDIKESLEFHGKCMRINEDLVAELTGDLAGDIDKLNAKVGITISK